MDSGFQIAEMSTADAAASAQMSAEAFGGPPQAAEQVTFDAGTTRWGLYQGATLAAKTVARQYESWFGGRLVPTAGVAGVAVAPEFRGTGAARRIMTHTLHRAHESGAAISTLFRTAPDLYRSLGYEQVAELTYGRIPTAALSRIRRVTGITVRRATVADLPAVREVYRRIGEASSGLLSRTGPSFTATDAEALAAFSGITLAEGGDGAVLGYASWQRGNGFGDGAAITVSDLLAVDGGAYRALLSQLGSWGSVAPELKIRTSGTDPIHWHIPGPGWNVESLQPYMLRVLDATTAVAARGWPADVAGSVLVEIDDPVCPWNSGTHRLTVGNGSAELAAGTGAGDPVRLTVTGLAVLYAGGVRVDSLRRAGLLQGGTERDGLLLDAAFAGPVPSIRDFF